MRYVRIPRTDLRASVICFGTALLGSAIDAKASFDLLDAYVGQGGNFVDTAKVYADWLGGERSLSEKTIGRWMRERGNRDGLIVATKGAHPEQPNAPRLSRAEITSDLDASLRHLRIDRVDLYWLHRDDPARPVEEIVDTLLELAAAGKIRHFGCSNWRVERIEAAQKYAEKCGAAGFVGDQMLWSLAAVDAKDVWDPTMVAMDDALWEFHRRTQMSAMAYTAQASGWFHKKLLGRPSENRMYAHPENEPRYERARRLCEETGLSMTAVVLGYLLSQPFPTFPIVGCHTLDQLADSLSAADAMLMPEQVHYLEQGG